MINLAVMQVSNSCQGKYFEDTNLNSNSDSAMWNEKISKQSHVSRDFITVLQFFYEKEAPKKEGGAL